MAITESQFDTWAHQGAITNSATTYNSIKGCIDMGNWNTDVRYDIYLQGSYKNSTNIYGNSDVDIVVQFGSIYSYTTENLSPLEKEYFDRDFVKAKYTLANFKTAIVKNLKDSYEENSVEVKNKAILVKGNGSRLNTDVIVCNPYRKYISYNANGVSHYVEGIVFDTEYTGKRIINFPKVHYENGATKNSQINTSGNYKSVVRIFKNMKATMVNKRIIDKNLAPSYFLECLIYNANNDHFKKNSYFSIVVDILKQFVDDIPSGAASNYFVQNEQRKLFGTDNRQWNINDATNFISRLVNFWGDN